MRFVRAFAESAAYIKPLWIFSDFLSLLWGHDTTMPIRLNGRPQRRWIVDVTPSEVGAVLRIDDENDAEFWLEVVVSLRDLERLVKEITERRESIAEESATAIRARE